MADSKKPMNDQITEQETIRRFAHEVEASGIHKIFLGPSNRTSFAECSVSNLNDSFRRKNRANHRARFDDDGDLIVTYDEQ